MMPESVYTTINARLANLPFYKRFFQKPIALNLPRRIKRLIFVASIFGLIENITNPNKAIVNKLNDILKIATSSDAIYFPIYVHSFIWRKLEKTPSVMINGTIVSIHDLKLINKLDPSWDSLSNVILDAVPAWLIYGSRELMKFDIQRLCGQALAI